MGWSIENLIVMALAIAIIVGLSLLGRVLFKRRRRARAIASADLQTRAHLKAIGIAIVSRNFEALGTVQVRIDEINRIAAAYGVDLKDLRVNPQKLDFFRTRAKEMLSGDDQPTQRLSASRPNSPFNTRNLDEPGTPDIPINALPDLSSDGWVARPVSQAIAELSSGDTNVDAIARMIEDVMSGQDGVLLPERKMIEVFTLDEAGILRSVLEPETEGVYIDLTFDDVTEEEAPPALTQAQAELSDEDRFEQLFDKMIEK